MNLVHKLKISLILGYPLPFAGAAWVRIAHFAQSWIGSGHDVEIVGSFTPTTHRQRGRKKEESIAIRNIMFAISSNHPMLFILNVVSSLITVFFYLVIRRPQVGVISVPTGSTGFGAILACWITRTKYVVDYRDQWEQFASISCKSKLCKSFYSVISTMAACFYRRALVVSVVTSNFKTELTLRGVNRCVLIPNGADTSIFQPNPRKEPSKQFTLIYTGEIGGYYRVDLIVRALADFGKEDLSNIILRIAGNGKIGDIQKAAREWGVLNRLDYLGPVLNRESLSRIIASADLGIIPYDDCSLWKNSLPAKFFEYCSCGLPVIATAHDDSLLAQLITKYSIGIVVPPNDYHRLAAAIKQIKNDIEYQSNASSRARAMILNNFNREKSSRLLLSIIQSCLR